MFSESGVIAKPKPLTPKRSETSQENTVRGKKKRKASEIESPTNPRAQQSAPSPPNTPSEETPPKTETHSPSTLSDWFPYAFSASNENVHLTIPFPFSSFRP
eukprot:Lithocolla_globosa_v1_NODE_897_length_3115_cov_8.205229.p4 type:complete len:102 gc:universal NODE_897_length_3115_cov_8.205229:1189-884(-)